MTRVFPAIILAFVLALSQPASAQGQGNGNAGGHGKSENGGGQGSGNGQGQSENAAGGHGGQYGNGFGQGNAGGGGRGHAASPPANGELSENEALAAVEAGRAVELATILPDVRARTGGDVINAQLLQVGAFLMYAVTVLTPAGQVLTEHYYARSGVHVMR